MNAVVTHGTSLGEFASLAAMQDDALGWCEEMANRRRCRPLARVAPQVGFDVEKKAALLPLPPSYLRAGPVVSAQSQPDIHIKVAKALYSVLWVHIGKTVDAREGMRTVEVYQEGKLIKTHVRIERGRQTKRRLPAFFMRPPAWCRRRASEQGFPSAEVVGAIMEGHASGRIRWR